MAFLTNVKLDWVKVLIFLVGIYFIVTLTQENLTNEVTEMAQPETSEPVLEQPAAPVAPVVAPQVVPVVQPTEPEQPGVKPEDLLPVYDEANEFAKQNPVSKLLEEQNFLVSGYHTGINTIMQSNKIAYHDLRSLPPIPKEYVGPWSQSSYEKTAGNSRRFFEIGAI